MKTFDPENQIESLDDASLGCALPAHTNQSLFRDLNLVRAADLDGEDGLQRARTFGQYLHSLEGASAAAGELVLASVEMEQRRLGLFEDASSGDAALVVHENRPLLEQLIRPTRPEGPVEIGLELGLPRNIIVPRDVRSEEMAVEIELLMRRSPLLTGLSVGAVPAATPELLDYLVSNLGDRRPNARIDVFGEPDYPHAERRELWQAIARYAGTGTSRIGVHHLACTAEDLSALAASNVSLRELYVEDHRHGADVWGGLVGASHIVEKLQVLNLKFRSTADTALQTGPRAPHLDELVTFRMEGRFDLERHGAELLSGEHTPKLRALEFFTYPGASLAGCGHALRSRSELISLSIQSNGNANADDVVGALSESSRLGLLHFSLTGAPLTSRILAAIRNSEGIAYLGLESCTFEDPEEIIGAFSELPLRELDLRKTNLSPRVLEKTIRDLPDTRFRIAVGDREDLPMLLGYEEGFELQRQFGSDRVSLFSYT